MNILSLFDGISCGRVALDRAGISVNKYYASEIDKYAIQISQKNYPDIIRLGDINNWENWDIDWSSIDLILAGSPCQGFSLCGKGAGTKATVAGEEHIVTTKEQYIEMKKAGAKFLSQSHLFWEFILILFYAKTFNHNVKFMLENTRMRAEYLQMITNTLGVDCITIDSRVLSAQGRIRNYWCNWKVKQPSSTCKTLKNVAHEYNDNNIDLSNYIIDKKYHDEFVVEDLTKRSIGYIRTNHSGNRVHNHNFPAFTLKAMCGGGAAKMGQYFFGAYPDDFYIRRLTPIECERLQTLPDNYTEGISNSQRYKCLGNGWTVDVIAHILKSMN